MAGQLNRAAWSAFDMIFRPWMTHHLRVCTSGLPAPHPDSGPVLIVSNHVSWWDGFLLRAVQKSVRPRSAFFTVALERELVLHPTLRMIGGIGVVPSSPSSILHAMRVVEQRCSEETDTVIGFFPQGRIAPSFTRPLAFTRGVELFARRIGTLTVIPVALHIEPVTGMAPTAFVRVGAPVSASDGIIESRFLESRIEGMLDATLASLSRHGEESVQHWTASAETEASAAVSRNPAVATGARRASSAIVASDHHA